MLKLRELSKKKRVLLIGISVVFVLMVLGKVLNVDISLYKSKISNNNTATRSESCHGKGIEEVNISYFIYKEDESKEVFSAMYNSENSVAVKGIYKWEFEGNYYIPLYKKFKVNYVMDMGMLNEEEDAWYTLEGKLEGTMDVKITGICTVGKTKKIIEKEVLKQCKKYLEEFRMSKNR